MKAKVLFPTLFSLILIATQAQAQTVTFTQPMNGVTVAGPEVTLAWTSEDINIQDADGQVAEGVGHYHLILLQGADAPLDLTPGQPIPRSDTMIHTTETSYTFTGLVPGEYTAYVVIGDGQHVPLQPAVQAAVGFRVMTLSIIEPANRAAIWGQDVNVRWVSEGITIQDADGQSNPDVGHFHLVLYRRRDARLQLEPGQPIPRSDNIVHLTDPEYRFEDLSPGPYTLFLVIGDGLHVPQNPPVAASVQFDVLEVDPGSNVQDTPWWLIALVVGGIVAGALLIQRL